MVADNIPDQTASAEYLVATPVKVNTPGLGVGVIIAGVVDWVTIDFFEVAIDFFDVAPEAEVLL